MPCKCGCCAYGPDPFTSRANLVGILAVKVVEARVPPGLTGTELKKAQAKFKTAVKNYTTRVKELRQQLAALPWYRQQLNGAADIYQFPAQDVCEKLLHDTLAAAQQTVPEVDLAVPAVDDGED